MLWRRWRLFAGWFRRWASWEFWPPWLFYLPLLPWLFLLAVRYRGAMTVTAVNPGISCFGQFLVNRKSDKLGALPRRYVPPFVLLRAVDSLATRLAQARAFATEQGFPVVLKPDIGGRGSGVWIVRTPEGLEHDIALVDYDVILQSFVDGEEYGIFWVRHPGHRRGRIVSITKKDLPFVTGDGLHSVEQLILSHPRAVCFSRLHLRNLGGRSLEIPASGEIVLIGELGTHSRGALFHDGRTSYTKELELELESLTSSLEGFHFGRFDVMVPSTSALQKGEGLQVMELNALGAEMTHIWDSRLGLRNAWRTLRWQWHIAYHFGYCNRLQGALVAYFRKTEQELSELWELHQRYESASGRRTSQSVTV
ncbi:MAG: hypothetical protein MK219_00545 [Candidatus Poseidoniia archaeon]|nr:hypothetical protein [Candidatus Poseidoniia archaeon]